MGKQIPEITQSENTYVCVLLVCLFSYFSCICVYVFIYLCIYLLVYLSRYFVFLYVFIDLFLFFIYFLICCFVLKSYVIDKLFYLFILRIQPYWALILFGLILLHALHYHFVPFAWVLLFCK